MDHPEGVTTSRFGIPHYGQMQTLFGERITIDMAPVPPGVNGVVGEHTHAGDGHGQVGGLDGVDGLHAITGEGHREAGDFVGRQALEEVVRCRCRLFVLRQFQSGINLPQMDSEVSMVLM